MNEPLSPEVSRFPWGFACVILFVGVGACGSSGGDQHPVVLAGDNAGGASGQSSGGTSAGSSGSKATGAGAGGTNSRGGGSSGTGNGESGTGGGTGGKGSSVAVGYCPGETPRSGYAACATDADCSGSTPLCRNEPYSGAGLCGACYRPTVECTDDASCGSGVCAPYTNSCSCSPNLRECAAACTATSCTSDEECANSGHCVSRSCTNGWTCQAGYRCNTAGASADTHGCEPVLCTSGYSCPTGYICSAAGAASVDPHGCLVIHCSQPGGVVCPTNSECVATSPGPGCEIRKCKTSSDCECGTCRSGFCASRPGICLPQPPP